MPFKSMADVANIIVRLRRHRKRAAQAHICSSSGDEPYTDARFRTEGALSVKQVPVEREYTFVCRDGVDTAKLVRLARGLLYEEVLLIGANVLVEEQCVHFHPLVCVVGACGADPLRFAGGHAMYAARGMTAGRSRFMCVWFAVCAGVRADPRSGPLLCSCYALRAARSAATPLGRTRTRRTRAHDHHRPTGLISRDATFIVRMPVEATPLSSTRKLVYGDIDAPSHGQDSTEHSYNYLLATVSLLHFRDNAPRACICMYHVPTTFALSWLVALERTPDPHMYLSAGIHGRRHINKA